MLARLAWSLLACGAVATAAAACGDVYADPDGEELVNAGRTEADAGSAVSASATLAPCPATRPSEESACDRFGSACEYGASADAQCNAVAGCVARPSSRVWESAPLGRCFANVCPSNVDLAALDGKPCGLDAMAHEGGTVTDADDAVCNVADGVCACTTGRGGASRHPRAWVCVRPLAKCPPHRPLIGQSCAGALWCDYGSCALKRGLAMECERGVWVASMPTCP